MVQSKILSRAMRATKTDLDRGDSLTEAILRARSPSVAMLKGKDEGRCLSSKSVSREDHMAIPTLAPPGEVGSMGIVVPLLYPKYPRFRPAAGSTHGVSRAQQRKQPEQWYGGIFGCQLSTWNNSNDGSSACQGIYDIQEWDTSWV